MKKIQKQLPLPGKTTIETLTRPFEEFARLESSGGILLIGCTLAALIWANSPWSHGYFELWHTKLTVGFAKATLSKEIHFWINDGLMAIFFLLVGLEIKREMLIGELASLQKAALPLVAAIGGMLLPAGFYFIFNQSGPGAAGWGVPMATDIAFALGVLTLLGDRVPTQLKVFLAALAIADDIGAVLVIAFFYTDQLSWISLSMAGAFFVALIVMNRIGARHPLIYIILGLGLWLAFLQSGIHATVAGVLLALTIPAHRRIDSAAFLDRSGKILEEFRHAEACEDEIEASATRSAALSLLATDCHYAEAPMLRFEHALVPWIKHAIMPIFALANAGVYLGGDAFHELVSPISLGIICGLVLGKPIGIAAFAWLAVQTRLAVLPTGVNWRQILGVGMLGGIGFTMSLFIASLAFASNTEIETSKIGILAASIVSALAGTLIVFKRNLPNDGKDAESALPAGQESVN
ncbi:MAG: Na+/H+ antiporter NhaA [Verrucomicrobiota bacterium]|nr:Na+/H+ antiporter NhaA [Verrucomicrobiota bacterium]